MKLRIRGDTVRLRLKRSEVERIAAGDSIAEQTHFPGTVLTYRLEAGSGRRISGMRESRRQSPGLRMSGFPARSAPGRLGGHITAAYDLRPDS